MAEWYTHTTQNRTGQPLRVRVSPPAQNQLRPEHVSGLLLISAGERREGERRCPVSDQFFLVVLPLEKWKYSCGVGGEVRAGLSGVSIQRSQNERLAESLPAGRQVSSGTKSVEVRYVTGTKSS